MKKLIALLVAGLVALGSPAIANNGKAPETPKGAAGQVSSAAEGAAERAKAAQEKAKEAAAAAAKAAEEAAKKEAEAKAAKAAEKAAQDKANEAAEAAKAAERSAGASEQAKQRAEEAKAAAEVAKEEAKEKAAEAKEKGAEAREAKASKVAKEKAATALAKVKGADDACLAYIEDSTSQDASGCETANYVVRFASGVDNAWQTRGLESIKVDVSQTLTGAANGVVAKLTPSQLAKVANSGRITTIEKDFVIKLQETQSGATWGLDRVDQPSLPLDSNYTNAQQGLGVSAYVVDTGILSTHEDFGSRVATGFSAISDGRGTIDCNGHGTHVAGTIAASTYGVAKSATLVPVRVMDCDGAGSLSTVLAGLDWISKNVNPGDKAVVNMSIGGGVSATLDSMVDALVGKGITVVVAAGNSASDACEYSPARATRALTVAASTQTDGFASFSNFGTCVDLIAPGYQITSTWITSNSSAAILSGTSMAAPHVSGLVASLLTTGYLAPSQVEYLLESQAREGAVSGAPSGTPNLLAQVASVPVADEAPAADLPSETVEVPEAFATAPVAPELTRVNYWRNSIRVFWNIGFDGGSPLTGHVLRVWSNGELFQEVEVKADSDNAKARGLDWGGRYTFTVVAINSIGESADSETTEIYSPDRTMRGLKVWRAN